MSDVINTARVLYRLIDNRSVRDDEFNQCMVIVFNFGGINDKEVAQQGREELVSVLRQQPRIPEVIKQWKKVFSRDGELTESSATTFIREVRDTIDELNIWFKPNILGGTLRYDKDSINDIHPHLTKTRPFWSLTLTIEGSGLYNCIRQDLLSVPGDLVLFSPTALIDIRRNDDCERWVHHHINFTVQSEWLSWLEWPEIGPNIYHLALGSNANKKRLASLFREIINIDPKNNPVSEVLKKNLLEQILIRCHELALQKKGKPIDSRITKIASYINENYNQDFTVEHLAEIGGLSRSRLSILFKEQMGMSLLQWRDEQRIAQACRLLLESSLHLSTIAERVGYQDPLYFGRCFRQHLGISPSKYRKEREVKR